jgi:hypothetical protein
MKKTFVMLRCWYDGDTYLVDDTFVAVGDIEKLKLMLSPNDELVIGETPDAWRWNSELKTRFRIIEVDLHE